MHALLLALKAALSLNGALSTSSASSPVTSATRTVLGGGTFLFGSVTSDDGTPQYSLNGGAWTNITESGTLVVAPGNTLAVRAALGTVGFTAFFQLLNNANSAVIQAVVLERT